MALIGAIPQEILVIRRMEKEVVEYSSNKIDILLTKNPINHALLLQNIMNKNSNCNYKNG